MDILSSRDRIRPTDLDRSRRFYRDILGLAIYREFGPADNPGVVFFLGQGLLEVSGHAADPAGGSVMIWIPGARCPRGARHGWPRPGVPVIREPVAEPWGLDRDVDRGPGLASGSSWSRFPPITRCAVTAGNRHREAGSRSGHAVASRA